MTGRSHALDLVPGLRDLAQRQLGVVHRDQLRALGVRPHHVAHQVAANVGRRTGGHGRAVEVLTGAAPGGGRHALGPRRRSPGCRPEALGLRDWSRDLVHVLVPQGGLPSRLPGVVAHQTRHLGPDDLIGGRWPTCTTAARAAIDAASWEAQPRTAGFIVVATVQQVLATAAELLAELGRRGPVPGLLREILAEAAGADAMSRSTWSGDRSLGLPEPGGRCWSRRLTAGASTRRAPRRPSPRHRADRITRVSGRRTPRRISPAAGYVVVHSSELLRRTRLACATPSP
jgi:hypothetical protein